MSLKDPGFWADFPFLASEELWERFTPTLLCPEIVCNRLDEAFTATRFPADISGVPPLLDLTAALVLADYLVAHPPQERAARFDDVMECGIHRYGEWAADMVLRYGREHPNEVTRLADALTGCRDMDRVQLDLALALAMAGRREQALQRVRQCRDASPGDFWVMVLAGDVYEELGDDEEAGDLWIRALSAASDRGDWDAGAQRIQDLLERTGHEDKWLTIEREAPAPAPPAPLPAPPPPRRSEGPVPPLQPLPRFATTSQLDPPFTRPSKVGRNDPCPCGSGKKHKKCCLRA